MQTLFIVGGAGFLGSSISKAAIARGWKVVSVSASGRPYASPAGHRPAWASSDRIEWHQADALRPDEYRDLLAGCTAAVHTVGILLESDYKKGGLLKGLLRGWASPTPNPLGGGGRTSYETMNRDTALALANTFRETRTSCDPFVYISAEDLFRPIVDRRYIDTKRQAEQGITALSRQLEGEQMNELMRPIFMRPGLMYHPHTRPISTLPAAILEASAAFHRKPPLPLPLPTPASLLAKSTTLSPLSTLLTTPPLHVDTVAQAVCKAIEDRSVTGPIDPQGIQRLAGWKVASPAMPSSSFASPQHRSFSTSARRPFFSLPDLSKVASTGPTVYETTKVLDLPRPLLYSTVANVSSYAEFVPYCQRSTILSPTTAELTVGFGSFKESYISEVASKPNEWVTATAKQPNPVFSELQTTWTFQEVDKQRTRVGFKVEYKFRNPMYGAVAGGVLERMSREMMGAFERRARDLAQ